MAKTRSCHGTQGDAGDPGLQEELQRAREEVQRLREQPTPPATSAKGPEILDR
ncbi:hypothetical protein ACIPSH_21200 [Streptomyces iakyrus]|uniref:Uncharacterized protein n=1 Tax=Streptomyces sp. SID7499 TaxID=2706086 RepID=A0A6G3WVN6_9ACTN|nr:hypothetical protein [Streptomyces sp. SID7499]